MFQPVMTQLAVVAAEAGAMPTVAAAAPATAAAARPAVRRAMSFLAGLVVTVLADMTTPFEELLSRLCVHNQNARNGWLFPRGVQHVLAGVSGPGCSALNWRSCRNLARAERPGGKVIRP